METEHFVGIVHSSESLQRAAQLPEGRWVQLDDLLLSLNGLSPRYALVQMVHGRQLSYAMLDLLSDAAFKSDRQSGGFVSKQQTAVALIRAAADCIDPADQLTVLRTVRWPNATSCAPTG